MCTSCSVIKLHLTLISNVGGARDRKHTGGARHWTGWELLSQMGVSAGVQSFQIFSVSVAGDGIQPFGHTRECQHRRKKLHMTYDGCLLL